jgi:acyl-CoA synthetase (AMP-forming)/AMP-acid ligase II
MLTVLRGPAEVAPAADSLTGLLAALPGAAPWLIFHRGDRVELLDGAAARSLARGWGRAFREAGVEPGDRVALLLPNRPDFAGAFFGALLAGATPVPLPWPVVAAADAQRELLAARLAVARPRALAVAAPLASGWALPTVTAPAPGAIAPAGAAELAFIQFTSGTTGAGRGAMVSQRAALASATAMARALDAGPRDVAVSWLPLFHDMGLVGVMLCSLAAGFPVHVLTPAEFLLRPARWIELLAATGATLTVAPNFGYELAARRAPARGLGALRHALSGSEPVHRSTIDAFEARFDAGGRTLPVYGLAEYSLGVTFSAPGEAAPDLVWQGRRVPSVGRPLAGTTVAVRAAEGEEGEILVRGPALMDGYLDDPAATARALDGGWLRTGDLGVVAAGRLHVTGREKDLVIKAGRKFHPYDIEQVAARALDAPPGGVVAFSVPGAGTEELVVVVEGRARDAPDAERRVRGSVLATLGVRVDRVRVVGVGTLPRTTSGKVRRGACPALVDA